MKDNKIDDQRYERALMEHSRSRQLMCYHFIVVHLKIRLNARVRK
ncbi:hypothetical protein ASZ90_019104 [hydrocarbon metagenome]|uniref:Uncharacterized protein n=1 Tax=hydrocarbon metagenome TaxID=938273 RepID=A0A0W8E494_9ZZZZ